jgi:hypothetical protein
MQTEWNVLPQDTLIHILSFLCKIPTIDEPITSNNNESIQQLNSMGFVCKHWKEASESDYLWRNYTLQLHAQLVIFYSSVSITVTNIFVTFVLVFETIW